MNCTNCGGHMLPDAAGRVWKCGYCQTSTRLLPDGPDGITITGPTSNCQCPAGCGTTVPSLLTGGVIDERPALVCGACRGLLLASANFAAVVRDRRAAWRGRDDRPQPLDRQQLERSLDCPRCHVRMQTHAYYGPGNTVIDCCERCELVWLDAGEVTAIERAPGQRQASF